VDLTQLKASEIADAVRTKKLSAVEVTNHFLGRIEKLDKQLNSFISINAEAINEAKKVDALIASGKDPGLLAGVPVAVKDLLCTEGLKTTAASKILANFIPPYDSTVVKRLKENGAIVIGKTNLDEFAMGSSNETSAFGNVKNPWNVEYVPGGSSGGSAAALAAHLAPIAIGTDTGGSIRQPASFCGVYGIKPTYGRVSRYGIIAYASSLDQAGPMAHSTQDCALMLESFSGVCKHDSTTSSDAVPKWSQNLKDDLTGMRIGLPKEYFAAKIDEDTQKIIDLAIKTVEKRGAKIVEISLPLVKYAVPIYYLIATSEASSNLARYDGIRFGHRADMQAHKAKGIDDLYSISRGEGFGTEVKRRIILGTYALSSGYYDAYYQKACQVRTLLRAQFVKAFDSCDVMLSPVTLSPAFKIGSRVKSVLEMYMNDIFTTSTNLTGLPGMSVPGGYSSQGLPIGVQITSRHFDEQSLLNVSYTLEKHLAKDARTPHVI
jgi:aspartyl-tRNA(Asn)/glutamyl-tRNA(Gln) amidotransferase subunit A